MANFPTTPILDAFTRADGALGSAWTSPIFPGDSTPQIFSNQMTGAASAFNSTYWNGTKFLNSECYVTVPATATSISAVRLYHRIANPNSGNEYFYMWIFDPSTSLIELRRFTAGSDSGAIYTGPAVAIAPGWKLGSTCKTVGGNIVNEVWLDKNDGNGWQLWGTYVDTGAVATWPTLAAAGYIGVEIYGAGYSSSTRALDDFGGGAALSKFFVKKGTFTLPTTTQSIPITGIGEPGKALILWCSRSTATGYATTAYSCIGFAVSSTQRFCAFIRIDDNVAATSSVRIRNTRTTRCLVPSMTGAGGGTPEMELDFTSWDSDGFTLALTVTTAGTAWVVHYMVIGGTDITNAAVFNNVPSTGTGVKNIPLTMMPDLVITAGDNNPLDGATTGAQLEVAAYTPSQSAFVNFRARDAASPSQDLNWAKMGRAYAAYQTGSDAVDHEAVLDRLNGGGIWLNHLIRTDPAVGLGGLALQGGTYDLRAVTQRTSTGTDTFTGCKMPPVGLFAFGASKVASPEADLSQAKMSFGGTDGTTEGCIWAASTDNVTTIDANVRHVTNKFFAHCSNPSTTDAECNATLTPDGYSLNWTTADAVARELFVIAMGPAIPPVISHSYVKTNFLRSRLRL